MKKFRDFESTREFVRKLGLKNANEWREYCKSGNKPDYITSVPERMYKNKGWKGLGDWLGTGTPSSRNRKYRSFNDTKKFVHKLKLKSEVQWNEYCKSGNKPDDIPQSAKTVYKNKGWISMGDFLGTGRIADQKKIFLEFKEAREFVRKLGLTSVNKYREYCNSGNKPDNMPSSPPITYKKEWKGWGDFLGNGNLSNKNKRKQMRSFKEAREFVRSLGLQGQKEWIEYCKSGNKPEDIPSNPQQTYNKRWKRK